MLTQTRRTRRACASYSRASSSLAARDRPGSSVGALVVAAPVSLAASAIAVPMAGARRRGAVVAAVMPVGAVLAGAGARVVVRAVVAARARARAGVRRLARGRLRRHDRGRGGGRRVVVLI